EARIRRERVTATELLARLDVKHEALVETLDVALGLTDNIQAADCRANPAERRLFNQAFFERLEVDAEEIIGHPRADPSAQPLARALLREAARPAPASPQGRPRVREAASPANGRRSRQQPAQARTLALVGAGGAWEGGNEEPPAFFKVGGSNVERM